MRIAPITALLFAASTAAAQPSATPQDDVPSALDRRDRSAITATVGLFAPTGTVGLEYSHALHENLELSAGAGLGYLIMWGLADDYKIAPQAAIMPRVRARFGAIRLAAGAGLSGGLEQEQDDPFSGSGYHGVDRMYVLRANVEGGAQLISRGGWFGRLSVGYGHPLVHSTPVSSEPGHEAMLTPFGMPYLSAGFGRTLQ